MRKVMFTLAVFTLGASVYLYGTNQHTFLVEYVQSKISPKAVMPQENEKGNTQTTTQPQTQPENPATAVSSTPESVKPEVKVNEMAMLVNKKVSIPSEYVPKDLVKPNVPFSFSADVPKKYMRKEAAEALESLFAQAKKENIQLVGVSAYRSYVTQKEIFDRNAKIEGEQKANQTSAIPGHSEHQTGLAIDVSSKSMNYLLSEDFANTPEGKWLKRNAPSHGFIIRYPKGKESITGYTFEPWHIRYVGVEMAKEIAAKDITLEEYLQGSNVTTKQWK